MLKPKKRNNIVEFDVKKIEEAILKAMRDDESYSKMLSELVDRTLLERAMRVADSPKAWKISVNPNFFKGRVIKNYNLAVKIAYSIKLKVINKENWYKVIRFVSKHIIEIGIKEIIKMVIVKLIESIKNRRELSKTSFYYANNFI